jgi:hypothetical protein
LFIRCFNIVQPETRFHFQSANQIAKKVKLFKNVKISKFFNSILNKIGYNWFIIFQDYLNIKILKSYETFERFEILWTFWFFKNKIKFLNFCSLNSIFSTLPQSEYTSRAVSTPRVRYIRACVYFCLLSIRCFNVVQPETRFHFPAEVNQSLTRSV